MERRETFKIGKKNCKTITFKLVPVKFGSLQEDIEVGVTDADILLALLKLKLREIICFLINYVTPLSRVGLHN